MFLLHHVGLLPQRDQRPKEGELFFKIKNSFFQKSGVVARVCCAILLVECLKKDTEPAQIYIKSFLVLCAFTFGLLRWEFSSVINIHIMLRLQQSRVRISTSCYKLNTCIKFKNPGLRNNYSVVDPDKYWIRIQKPSGSGSVFGIRIRIHTCKYRIKCRQKIKDKKYKFTVPRLNRVKICSRNILFLLYSIKKNWKRK